MIIQKQNDGNYTIGWKNKEYGFEPYMMNITERDLDSEIIGMQKYFEYCRQAKPEDFRF